MIRGWDCDFPTNMPPLLITAGLPYVPLPAHHLYKVTGSPANALLFPLSHSNKLLNQEEVKEENGQPKVAQMSKQSNSSKEANALCGLLCMTPALSLLIVLCVLSAATWVISILQTRRPEQRPCLKSAPVTLLANGRARIQTPSKLQSPWDCSSVCKT